MELKSIFIGSHLWFVPFDVAFTSPSADTVTQNGVWPDADEPNWNDWALGICESCNVDPKPASPEMILAPSPGAVQAIDEISPYGIPEVDFTLLQVGPLAVELSLNTQRLFVTGTTQFNPNGGGAPFRKGILKIQQYDQDNNLILNWESWVSLKLKSALKGAPKSMTKPEFAATLLYSPNNTGSI